MQLNDADTIVAVLLTEDIAALAGPAQCIAPNCSTPATWLTESLTDYCDEHALEWLLAEAVSQ